MLDDQGHLLPHAWVAGDDEMGRTTAFRKDLNDRGEQYLLAVPSNTAIRDLEATPRLMVDTVRFPRLPSYKLTNGVMKLTWINGLASKFATRRRVRWNRSCCLSGSKENQTTHDAVQRDAGHP